MKNYRKVLHLMKELMENCVKWCCHAAEDQTSCVRLVPVILYSYCLAVHASYLFVLFIVYLQVYTHHLFSNLCAYPVPSHLPNHLLYSPCHALPPLIYL